jgi:hypothetical protein
MKSLQDFLTEKLHISNYKKEEDIKMPTDEKVIKLMFNACMECENDSNIYKNYFNPLVQELIKKDPKDINLKKLETSSDVMDITIKSINKAKKTSEIYINLSTDDKLLLCKYITAIILKSMTGFNYEQTQEQEDYMIEWDFYNGPNKFQW